MLRYNNYLLDKINQAFSSLHTFVDISKKHSYENIDIDYSLNLDEDSLKSQAKIFAKVIYTKGFSRGSYISAMGLSGNILETIENAYIYSYFKSVYYALNSLLGNASSITTRTDDYVFYGHKILHDVLVATPVILNDNTQKRSVFMRLVEIQDRFQAMESFSKFDDYFEIQGSSIVQNFEYDTILNFINEKNGLFGNVVRLGSEPMVSAKSFSVNPLGNSFVSTDNERFYYIENDKTSIDYASFFWPKACMLCIDKNPETDSDDMIYNTIDISEYDSSCYGYEVYSITGIMPYSENVILGGRNSLSDDDNNHYGNGGGFRGNGSPRNPNNGPGRRGVNPNGNKPNNRKESTKLNFSKEDQFPENDLVKPISDSYGELTSINSLGKHRTFIQRLNDNLGRATEGAINPYIYYHKEKGKYYVTNDIFEGMRDEMIRGTSNYLKDVSKQAMIALCERHFGVTLNRKERDMLMTMTPIQIAEKYGLRKDKMIKLLEPLEITKD